MAEETKKPDTQKKSPLKGKKKKVYPELKTEQLKEIIDLLQEKKKPEDIQKKYNISSSLLTRIKSELRKQRRPVKDFDGLPKNYFVVRSIGDRVDNILFDRGYVKLD